MNTNNEINLQRKSLADLPGLDYYKLLDKFSILCSSDIEKICNLINKFELFKKRKYFI